MAQRKALLLGATGLTGGFLLDELLNSEVYSEVTIYVRSSTGKIHPKLVEQLVDFNTLQTWVEADDIFCCLGATIKTVKTKEAFANVDLLAPLHIAKLQLAAGSKRFLVMSAAGADAKSKVFYNKIKGQLEAGLKKLNYPSLYIFQPSFILGERKQRRKLEEFGISIAKFVSPILSGKFKKYLPVTANAIAKSMLHFAKNANIGAHTIPSDIIKKWEE
jgi:uncharacterized protein YbjT (DUF2867 family)